MPTFSSRSLANLASCDERLQRVMYEAIKFANFAVICGHRGQEDQTVAYATGRSQTPWPESKHNANPALAVDVVPCPIDWGDLMAFDILSVTIKRCASDLGVNITWGGDWPHFKDRPHYEVPDPWPRPASEETA